MRPTIDIVNQLVADLKTYVKKADNTAVEVQAGWITERAKIPIATVTKIGEWSRVLEVQGVVKEAYADVSIDLWGIEYADLYAMAESCQSRLSALRKAYQDKGIIYMVDMTHRRLYEPDIAPLVQREQIVVRLWWFE